MPCALLHPFKYHYQYRTTISQIAGKSGFCLFVVTVGYAKTGIHCSATTLEQTLCFTVVWLPKQRSKKQGTSLSSLRAADLRKDDVFLDDGFKFCVPIYRLHVSRCSQWLASTKASTLCLQQGCSGIISFQQSQTPVAVLACLIPSPQKLLTETFCKDRISQNCHSWLIFTEHIYMIPASPFLILAFSPFPS